MKNDAMEWIDCCYFFKDFSFPFYESFSPKIINAD